MAMIKVTSTSSDIIWLAADSIHTIIPLEGDYCTVKTHTLTLNVKEGADDLADRVTYGIQTKQK